MRRTPEGASLAEASEGEARLFSASAARNAGPLAEIVAGIAPSSGRALELASGTGQHAVAYAAAAPGLLWTPSEVDAARRASIDAHAAASGLANIAPAIALDATEPGWGAAQAPCALIVLSNLLHLISESEARVLITEAAAALAPGGRFLIYGPFRRDGALVSAGDAEFDAKLRAQDTEIGYKDDADLRRWLAEAGLTLLSTVAMPANNLAFVAERG